MIFNSLGFLIFFPVVTLLYFLLPHRHRWWMLLIASCLFYMTFIPRYILILFVLIIIDYAAGRWLDRPGLSPILRKAILWGSILSTCLVLFIFKYFIFFNYNVARLADLLNWNYPISALQLVLPVGLSFHTFQSLSYVIEVYRGNQKAERDLGIYALYVMFYPQLVAGPIERPQNLLHQFRTPHTFEYMRVVDGLKLMLWGMFKKVVIADQLAAIVTPVYAHPDQFSGLPLMVATVFFAFQIYCDFSGYSDIAIGAAQVMGFRLMDNFNRPYSSKSIAEFWKSWHISLSTWFRDYVYIPLGGNRTSRRRWHFNLFITFLISGLWHGANWTYVAWGALNGFYLLFAFWTHPLRENIRRTLGVDRIPWLYAHFRVLVTFSLVCIGWVFFRSRNIDDAWYILTHMLRWDEGGLAQNAAACLHALKLTKFEFLLAVVPILFMEFVHSVQRHRDIRHMLVDKPAWFRWSFYYMLTAAIAVAGLFLQQQEFIYFQF